MKEKYVMLIIEHNDWKNELLINVKSVEDFKHVIKNLSEGKAKVTERR